ncbi:MAG: hypothetical protein K0B02_05380, partial [DPANN group archaeon]|nr:hypothetical protein [DPANN group archaeon]
KDKSSRRDIKDKSSRRDIKDKSSRRDIKDKSSRRDIKDKSSRRDIKDKSSRCDIKDKSSRRDKKEKSSSYDLNKEYLIEWSSDLIPFITERLIKDNVYNIPANSLNLSEDDLNKFSDLMDSSFKSYKVKRLKTLRSEEASLKLEEDSSKKELRLRGIQRTIDYFENKSSVIESNEQCLIGLDSEKCKSEWLKSDNLDKFAYTDILDKMGRSQGKMFLSNINAGCYISTIQSEISIPIDLLVELKSYIDDLHPSIIDESKYVKSMGYKYTKYDFFLTFELEEDDNIYPPYSMDYNLSRNFLKVLSYD